MIKISQFSGISPRTGKAMIEGNEAQIAKNCKLYSGELRPWDELRPASPQPVLEFEPRTIYRAYGTSVGYVWFAWDVDVNVVDGPIFDNTAFQLYWTGDGIPKKANSTMSENPSRTVPGPFDVLDIGVPNPITACRALDVRPKTVEWRTTSTPTGEKEEAAVTYTEEPDLNDFLEYRVYTYTFVSQFGDIQEETGPAPASNLLSVYANPKDNEDFGWHVEVTNIPEVPPPGNHNIQKVRIYRSAAGSDETYFRLVGEIPIGQTVFIDRVKPENLGEPLATEGWGPPPNDLSGLVALPNGILAGFVENKLLFSVPYQPHAWPTAYEMTVDYTIVGLGVFGQSVVVATQGYPYLAAGTDSESMTLEKLPLFEPCMSKRSIVSDEAGVMYASPNGVASISIQGVQNATRTLLTKVEWEKYTPQTMLGSVIDGRYFLFYDSAYPPFETGALILDRHTNPHPLTTTNVHAKAVHVDVLSSSLWIYETGSQEIKEWDSNRFKRIPYQWKSKFYIGPRPVNFGAFQIEADYSTVPLEDEQDGAPLSNYAQIVAANQILIDTHETRGGFNQTPLLTLAINASFIRPAKVISLIDGFLNLKFYCQEKLVHEKSVVNDRVYRMPSGFMGQQWEIEANGNIPVRVINVAQTPVGLKQI